MEPQNVRERPDVLLIANEWPDRSLVRAELIDAGYDVVAIDSWPIPGEPGMQPRVMIVDLRGLSDPTTLLRQIPSILPPDRVLVITALGTISADELRRAGYRVISRPVRIGDIVAAAGELIGGS